MSADPNIVTSTAGPPAKVSPQAGMTYPVAAPADPTGKIFTGCTLLMYLPSAAYGSATIPYYPFSTQYITNCSFDATVTAFTGGSSPTITFVFERQGADGNWYPILPLSGSGVVTVSVPTTVSLDIGLIAQSITGGGPSPVYGAAHSVFTPTSRVRWAYAGTPSSVTFSLSLYGR